MNTTVPESSTRKRPVLVWIISIFYVLSAGWTLLSFSLIYSGMIPLNDAQRIYFQTQNIFDIIFTIIIGIMNLAGAVFLFTLKRYAFHSFLIAFIISMIMTVYHIVLKNWLAAIGGPGLVGAVLGWAISIAIILYSRSLLKRGLLK